MSLSRFLLILSLVYVVPVSGQDLTPIPVWKSAVETGDLAKLQSLSPSLSASDWGQALRSAILRHDAALARAIIARFPEPKDRKILIEGTDQVGRTALMLAIATLQNDLASELLDMGANINVITTDVAPIGLEDEFRAETRQTPLSKAFFTQNEPLVRLLIERGANLDISVGAIQGDAVRALVMQAIATRNRPLLDLLLPKIPKTGNRFSALSGSFMANGLWEAAMIGGDLEIVKALHAAGVPLDPVNEDPLNQSTKSALLMATATGQLEIARWLIQNGANVNVSGSQSSSPLQNAIRRNDIPMVDLLLASKAKPPVDGGREYLNLLWTTLDNRGYVNPIIVKKLLEQGAHLPEKYAVYEAAIRGDIRAFQALKDNWQQVDEDERTPMHLAALMNQAGILSLLLAEKIPQTADGIGQTPLFYAFRGNAVEASRLLIESGADVKVADKQGVTALHLAVAKSPQPVPPKSVDGKPVVAPVSISPSMTDLVALLLKNGADAGAVVTKGYSGLNVKGTTPLHNAAFHGNLPAIEALLAAKAAVAPLNSMEQTPLDMAARGGQDAAIALLISKGAKPGVNTLALAATPIYDDELRFYPDYTRGSRVTAIKKLVALGGDPDTAGPNRNPPLIALIPEVKRESDLGPEHSPVEGLDNWKLEQVKARQRVAIATALLESGANPNVRSVGRESRVYGISDDAMAMPTALHLAVETGDELLVQTLLKWKADPTIWDGVGRTPYDLVLRRGENSAYYKDSLLGYEPNTGRGNQGTPPPILYPIEVSNSIKAQLEKAGGAIVGPGPFLQGIKNNAIRFVTQTLKTQPALANAQGRPEEGNRNFTFSTDPESSKRSALEIFAISRPEIRLLLLRAGAKPTFKLLNSVLLEGEFKLADELLKAGTPLQPPSTETDIAPLIHQAALEGNVPMLKWLLDNGVSIDQLDEAGQSPLTTAKNNRQADAVAYLTERGGREIK